MHDLRSDIAKIHHEISELRKLVESSMDWQAKLQHSIKQEVSDAVCQSGKCLHFFYQLSKDLFFSKQEKNLFP